MATSGMKEDIEMGVRFIQSIVKNNPRVTKEQLDRLGESLNRVLCERYTGHWYPDKPTKGQAYRCIRINRSDPVDISLQKACQESGMEYGDLSLPREFTLWIDPGDVSCRLSERSHPFQVSEEYRSRKASPEPETSDYHSASPAPSTSSTSSSDGCFEDEGRAKLPGQAPHAGQPGTSYSQQAVQYYYLPTHLWVPWQHHTVTFLPAFQPVPVAYVPLPSNPPATRRRNPDLVKRLTNRASRS